MHNGTMRPSRRTMSIATTYGRAEVLSASEVLACGWLEKEGQLRKTWKRRYFRLRKHYLSYYRNEDEMDPVGSIDLRSSSTVGKASERDDKYLCFKVISGDRRLFVRAANMKEYVEWLEILRVVLSQLKDDEVRSSLSSDLEKHYSGPELEFRKREEEWMRVASGGPTEGEFLLARCDGSMSVEDETLFNVVFHGSIFLTSCRIIFFSQTLNKEVNESALLSELESVENNGEEGMIVVFKDKTMYFPQVKARDDVVGRIQWQHDILEHENGDGNSVEREQGDPSMSSLDVDTVGDDEDFKSETVTGNDLSSIPTSSFADGDDLSDLVAVHEESETCFRAYFSRYFRAMFRQVLPWHECFVVGYRCTCHWKNCGDVSGALEDSRVLWGSRRSFAVMRQPSNLNGIVFLSSNYVAFLGDEVDLRDVRTRALEGFSRFKGRGREKEVSLPHIWLCHWSDLNMSLLSSNPRGIMFSIDNSMLHAVRSQRENEEMDWLQNIWLEVPSRVDAERLILAWTYNAVRRVDRACVKIQVAVRKWLSTLWKTWEMQLRKEFPSLDRMPEDSGGDETWEEGIDNVNLITQKEEFLLTIEQIPIQSISYGGSSGKKDKGLLEIMKDVESHVVFLDVTLGKYLIVRQFTKDIVDVNITKKSRRKTALKITFKDGNVLEAESSHAASSLTTLSEYMWL